VSITALTTSDAVHVEAAVPGVSWANRNLGLQNGAYGI